MKKVQTIWLNRDSLIRQRYSTLCSRKASYTGFIFLVSIFLVAFSGCGSTPTNTGAGTQTRVISTDGPEISENRLQAVKDKAMQMVKGMTLEQKLGQLIVVEYLGNSYQDSGLQYMVTQQYVGGVIYQDVNHNFDAPDNTVAGLAAFSQQMQQDAKISLLVGTDQEGGQVNRLQIFHGSVPSAATMAASGDPNYVFQQGVQNAEWMQQLGINNDLAPVVDVHTVDPPVLQDRMFGATPQAVETYAGAFLNGLQQNGVAGCLKHFPGLGAVTSDPHLGLPTINRSLTDLEKIDLAPYKAFIEQNPPAMIMDTDVLVPVVDPDLPAELSPKAINGLLRGQLGYKSVVMTDGLYMQGISARWTLSQAATLAIIAGNDLIEGPYTVQQVASVVTALEQALQNGQLTLAHIDQSVERILQMKMLYKIIK